RRWRSTSSTEACSSSKPADARTRHTPAVARSKPRPLKPRRRPTVVIGLLGATLDRGGPKRWERWRPTVDVCRHEDFVVDRLEVLHTPGPRGHAHILDELEQDLAIV